jgi:hypothetical protein
MISEFIGPLSATYATPLHEYESFKVLFYLIIGRHSMIKLQERHKKEMI